MAFFSKTHSATSQNKKRWIWGIYAVRRKRTAVPPFIKSDESGFYIKD